MKMTKTSVGETLQVVIRQAMEQGRLTCGVQDCAHMLEIDHYNVMLCILPGESSSTSDVSVHIHHMLIEAFCREYEIRLIKAGSQAQLADLVKKSRTSPDNCAAAKQSHRADGEDVSCLILQYPENGCSEEEEILAEHYKTAMYSDSSQQVVIPLPD